MSTRSKVAFILSLLSLLLYLPSTRQLEVVTSHQPKLSLSLYSSLTPPFLTYFGRYEKVYRYFDMTWFPPFNLHKDDKVLFWVYLGWTDTSFSFDGVANVNQLSVRAQHQRRGLPSTKLSVIFAFFSKKGKFESGNVGNVKFKILNVFKYVTLQLKFATCNCKFKISYFPQYFFQGILLGTIRMKYSH